MPETPESPVDAYPLTPMQQGMLYHCLAEPTAGRYLQQVECELTGELDVDAFRRAWQATIDRHDILRSAFYWEGLSEPLQVVCATADQGWTFEDHADLPKGEHADRFEEYRRDDLAQGIDLSRAPLMRCALFRVAPGRHRFLWTHHHIILDGSSFTLVLTEVFNRYSAAVEGRSYTPKDVPRFREHVALVHAQDHGSAMEFWRSRLADVRDPIPIPGLRDAGGRKAAGAELHHVLDADTTARLDAFARRHRLSAATLGSAAWARALGLLAGTTDIVFGTTVAGRPVALPDAESMVGLFINTLPVRLRVPPGGPTPEWLTEVQEELVQARDFDQTPLVDAQGCAGVPRGVPLFESLLLVQSFADEPPHPPGRAGLTVQFAGSEPPRTGYPVTMMVVPGAEWRLRLIHDTATLGETDARRLLEVFARALAELPGEDASPAAVEIASDVIRVQVAGTFTVTAMADTARFWLRRLGLAMTVGFGRYGHMQQELIMSDSPLAQAAYRLLFVRPADLAPQDEPGALAAAVDDLATAVRMQEGHGRTLVVVCPSAAATPHEEAAAERLGRALAGVRGVAVTDARDLVARYGIDEVHDPAADRAGHVPYTPEFLAALITDALRAVVAAAAGAPSVLVLDGDGLLWDGAAGEDASAAQEGSPGRAAVQAAREWIRAGRRVALATRGAPDDVEEALAHCCEGLRADSLASVWAGWEPVSTAVAAVAADLDVPESELLYLTADPATWADVRANCAGAQTVHAPSASYVDHLWTLDVAPAGWTDHRDQDDQDDQDFDTRGRDHHAH